MSKKYIIGIDGGSQSTKVVMYDLEGNVVCEGQRLITADAHARCRYCRNILTTIYGHHYVLPVTI